MESETYETLAQLKARLHIGTSTVYRWMKKGLPSIKVEGTRRFPVKRVDRWLRMTQGNNHHQ